MKENIWSKTLLGVYRHLEAVADAIDKITLKTALNSYHFSMSNNDILKTSNRLIDLGERKVTLINLKVLIEDILSSMQEKDADILICRYIENIKFKDIALEKNIGLRTVFRRVERAEDMFSKKLEARGYSDLKLRNMLKNEKWIMNYYDDIAYSKSDEVAVRGIAL